MYADTSDSAFSKGSGGGGEMEQENNIHLAYPLGGVEYATPRKTVEADANALAKDLTAWADGAADWVEAILVDKRDALRHILQRYGQRHLAETRLPNNDVSLWQHSYSAAAIFKALLASYLLRNEWKSLVKDDKLDADNPDLCYVVQHLALLAVRWDDDAYLARSVRPYDIVGRRAHLYQLSQEIRGLVEDTLCLGNQIYADNSGICFLVPDLQSDKATEEEKSTFHCLCKKLDNLCNGGIFQGELPWKLLWEPSGLRLTDMLRFWNTPFADALGVDLARVVSTDDVTLQWRSLWNKADAASQICPRCGLRPMPWSDSRTGADSDKGYRTTCTTCATLNQKGAGVIKALRQGLPTDFSNYGQEAFGLDRIPDYPHFWNMLDKEIKDDGDKENRLALVQGFIPLDTLYDGTLFDHLLSPLPKSHTSWQALEDAVADAWAKVWQKDTTGTVLDTLLGSFGGEKDGWCSDAEPGHYQRRWMENLIFGHVIRENPAASPKEAHSQARRIITWALRRHPSPSRMARVWEQTRAFMRSAFRCADEDHIPFVPLTCDAGHFQILLPAGKAFSYMTALTRHYEDTFGRVRHLLPLHLSAAVFYRKAPMYIAMDAARRFRHLAQQRPVEYWKLVTKKEEDKGAVMVLHWQTPDRRHVTWKVPALLPNGMPDPYHTWMRDIEKRPVPLDKLEENATYAVRPSTFDFEVLDASTRRYDIRYRDEASLDNDTRHAPDQAPVYRRPHFMMPHSAGPRPYPLEELQRWQECFAPLFLQDSLHQNQRKTALELVARLHTDWHAVNDSAVFATMVGDILKNTMDVAMASRSSDMLATLNAAARDGTFFDLYEWYDFIGSPATGENA